MTDGDDDGEASVELGPSVVVDVTPSVGAVTGSVDTVAASVEAVTGSVVAVVGVPDGDGDAGVGVGTAAGAWLWKAAGKVVSMTGHMTNGTLTTGTLATGTFMPREDLLRTAAERVNNVQLRDGIHALRGA